MVRSYLLRSAWSLAILCALLALAGCSTSPAAPAGQNPDGAAPDAASVAAVPGRYLTTDSVAGEGSCAGLSLADVLAKIYAAEPTLADIQTIYNPASPAGDGSFIYPYQRNDGGFDVVFKR